MLEYALLGFIQGIFEWLPVSSEGIIVLLLSYLTEGSLPDLIRFALFLHLGTFFAALIYFRREVFNLTVSLFRYDKVCIENQKTIKFLIIATLVSGVIGIFILQFIVQLIPDITGKYITLGIGLLLLVTGILQLKIKDTGLKKAADLTIKDGILLGIMQGLAILPGLSRSGLTISAFLLKKYDKTDSLKLSFLMSLPVVLLGNIILNYEYFFLTLENTVALLFAFIFGLLTIHYLIKLSKRINFGYFVLFFAAITIAFGLVLIF